MKKLMIAAAIVCAAAFAQAATAQWSAKINGATSAGIATSDYVAYFFAGTYDGTAEGLASAKDSATFSVDPTASTRFITGDQTFTADATAMNYQIILVNAAQTQYAVLGSGSYTPYGDLEEARSVDPSTTGAKIKGTAGSGNLEWSNIQGGAVPEPTSAMLLLLGVAGLALRRRRA